MRLSADKTSPFYSDRAVRCAQVFVDGIPIKAVVDADTEEGWAHVIATRDDGTIVVDHVNPNGTATIRYTGAVTVEFLGE